MFSIYFFEGDIGLKFCKIKLQIKSNTNTSHYQQLTNGKVEKTWLFTMNFVFDEDTMCN